MEASHYGLSSTQAKKRIETDGLNEIPETKKSLFQRIFAIAKSPITIMLTVAALLSEAIGKTFDFYFIVSLLLLNLGITVWQEHKADGAVHKLNSHLTQLVKTLRDSAWKKIDARKLVRDDIVELHVGDIVPADGVIIEGKNVSVNEASLTGESLPQTKADNDLLYSGTYITTGQATFRITATGPRTKIGKTLFTIEKQTKRSLLEKDIIRISQFLSILSVLGVLILTVIFLLEKQPLAEVITLDLSLIIAGIPISLPTVMTLIILIGVVELSKKHVIVRRLSALEDLANVTLLLTDKTGTLTKNKITVQDINTYGGFEKDDVTLYGYIASLVAPDSPIESAIAQTLSKKPSEKSIHIIDYTPADSVRKHSTVTAAYKGKPYLLALGAPQVIEKLCDVNKTTKEKMDKDIALHAEKGSRAVALAVKTGNLEEKNMKLACVFALADELRNDALHVIDFMRANDIEVAMLTGDNQAISQEIATKLQIPGKKIITKTELKKIGWDHLNEKLFHDTQAFAEILPDDKYKLVHHAKHWFIVATNGDGVNDIPAVKEAHVGIAVANAVSSLKATADIVLLTDGIEVIRDAIIEGRKIFARIYAYSVYRISESLRLIITIVVLGMAYRVYPLTTLQLILVALLNDIPIISLAFNRVESTKRPSHIPVTERFILSSLFGLVGVANSIILFVIMDNFLHLSWPVIQTIYFLKLTVSGHLLIYVAHTKKRWYKYLPSKEVIWATTITQILATVLALTGFLMPARISLKTAILVWGWAFLWMQIGEGMKIIQEHFRQKYLSEKLEGKKIE